MPKHSKTPGSSTSAPDQPRARHVAVKGDVLIVSLEDGRELRVPVEWFPRLRDASPRERAEHRLIGGGVGIHFPRIDEDISVRGLLAPAAGWVTRKTA
jgi:hypothetical protein